MVKVISFNQPNTDGVILMLDFEVFPVNPPLRI